LLPPSLPVAMRTFRATKSDVHVACSGMFTQKLTQCCFDGFIEEQWHLPTVVLRVRRSSDRTWGHEVKEADVCLFESRKAIGEACNSKNQSDKEAVESEDIM